MALYLQENQIIQLVREREILYNSNFPGANRKNVDKAWDEVAKSMNLPVEEVRRRWKNIRDCYSKFLRSKQPGQLHSSGFLKRYRHWPWAPHVAFLKPFVKFRPNRSRFRPEDDEEEEEQQVEEPTPDSEETDEKLIDLKEPDVNTYYACDDVSATTSCNKYADYEDVDLLFLGYAKTMKKFSQERQAIVKMKIATLMMEEELAQIRGDTHSKMESDPFL